MTNYIRIEKKIRKDNIWKRGGGGTGCEEPRREEDLVGVSSLTREMPAGGQRRKKQGSMWGTTQASGRRADVQRLQVAGGVGPRRTARGEGGCDRTAPHQRVAGGGESRAPSPGREGGRPRNPSRGSPRVTDGKPADGSRRRRVSQGPAEQGVVGAGREPVRLEGTGEGGARRITGGSPAGGRMERGSVSPAGGPVKRIVGGA